MTFNLVSFCSFGLLVPRPDIICTRPPSSPKKSVGASMPSRDVETAAVLIQVEGRKEGRLNYPMECENGKGGREGGRGKGEALSVIAWQRL